MTMARRHLPAEARFDAGTPTKADLFRGAGLFAGLNCFEPGQGQRVHAHAGADKFYFVASGKASMQVGDDLIEAVAGDVVWAAAGVPHGVLEARERTVMLVAMGPPPG